MNPLLDQALADARHQELSRQFGAARGPQAERRQRRSVRNAAGWFLVGLGLRLAVSRARLSVPAP